MLAGSINYISHGYPLCVQAAQEESSTYSQNQPNAKEKAIPQKAVDHQVGEKVKVMHRKVEAPPPGGASGGESKLRGNPPTEFHGNRLKVEEFMHQSFLYCLANIDTEQMANPMQRMVLFLGFIKGLSVKDWVKCWTT